MALPSTTLPSLPKSALAKRKSKRASSVKRKRGGQPGNNNARTLGIFSLKNPSPLGKLHLKINALTWSHSGEKISISKTLKQTEPILEELDEKLFKAKDAYESLAIQKLMIQVVKFRCAVKESLTPYILKHRALQAIAHDPFGYFERHYKAQGLSRDADSFSPVSNLSARNSQKPPSRFRGGVGGGVENEVRDGVPNYATNLTDEQWAIIAPLIPPDPTGDWLLGDPPVIIAASRWGFTPYLPTGEFNDFAIMQNYYEIRQRYPALLQPPLQITSPLKRKRGRPRNHPSPRALLDAILWKLATGHNWDDLPLDFPPMRLCRKYYRRLFLSGRLYTILLALYNHMRLEGDTDPELLLEQGVFTTTPVQNIALRPGIPQTWQNYTALLFMQLAREAYSYFEKERKQKNPFHLKIPVFKGSASLSTAMLPVLPPTPTFQPIAESLLGRKMRKIERDRKTIDRMVKKRTKAYKKVDSEEDAEA